jgi:hypothetical protein
LNKIKFSFLFDFTFSPISFAFHEDSDDKKLVYSKQKRSSLNETANSFIKCDSLSDSEEELFELHERGGPDRNKRRSSRKKRYQILISVSASEINQQKLKFLSSGCIIQNNDLLAEHKSFLENKHSSINSSNTTVTDQFNISLNSWSNNNESPNLFSAHQNNLNGKQPFSQSSTSTIRDSPISLQDHLIDSYSLYYNDKEIENNNLYTYSPESGYDTSPPAICSPSPSLTENQFCNVDESKEINSIIDSIIELENTLMPSKDLTKNVPKLDIQELKNFLKESPVNENLESESHDIIFDGKVVHNFHSWIQLFRINISIRVLSASGLKI